MVREDVIDMAREIGIWPFIRPQRHEEMADMLARLAFLVAEREREECAKVCDANAAACNNNSILRDVLAGSAAAIRARGNT